MLASMSFFHPWTMFSTKELLAVCKIPPDKSIALGQSNFRIPLEFMTGGLLHHIVNRPLVCSNPPPLGQWAQCNISWALG